MMRLIGRVLLAVAAALLIYSGIMGIISGNETIQALGGWGSFNKDGYWQAVLGVVGAILNIVLGLPALYGFIRGRCGFWMLVFAIILGVNAGYTIYNNAQAGKLSDVAAIWNLVLSLLAPVCYALGTIFILLRKRD